MPMLESLEDRVVPATFTVNSLADNITEQNLTLRAAVQLAEESPELSLLSPAQLDSAIPPGWAKQIQGPFGSDNTIEFSQSIDGGKIILTNFSDGSGNYTNPNPTEAGPSAFFLNNLNGQNPSDNLTIDGLTGLTKGITIERSTAPITVLTGFGTSRSIIPDFRLFDVGPGASLTLEGLTLSNGMAQGFNGGSSYQDGLGGSGGGGGAAGMGGAIFNEGSLSLLDCTLTGNTAQGGNGGNVYSGTREGGAGGGGLGAYGQSGADRVQGGALYSGNGGGPNGGSGGFTSSSDQSSSVNGYGGNFGGGGGGGQQGAIASGDGGQGGFGGGGGGAGGINDHAAGNGGSGGFGGGGGGGGKGFTQGTGGGGPDGGGAGGGTIVGGEAYAGGGGGGAGLGGAIFNEGGNVTITNTTLTGNTANGGAGGIAVDSKANGEDGTGVGGAVFSHNGIVTINDSTLSGNTAAVARNINVYGKEVPAFVTINNTIIGQSDTSASDSDLAIGGSVLVSGRGNLLRAVPQVDSGFVINTLRYEIADPLLATKLGSNGGTTQTLALLPGSPAVDAGSVAAVPAGLTTDQRGPGYPRFDNGTVDIGAYEHTVQQSQQSQTINFSLASPVTYGVAPMTLNATSSSGLPVTYSLISGPGSISGNTLTVTGAGSIVVEAEQVGNATFTAATPVQQTLVVNKAALTVTGSGTQVFGGSPNFSASYGGFVFGQGPSALGGTLAFSTTTTSNSPVGTYTNAVTPGGLTSSNYNIIFVKGNMVVTKAALTVTVTGSGTQVYGGSPTFSASYSGFAPGQGPSALGGTLTFSTTTTSSSPVGTYTGAVTPGGLTSSNYNITFVKGNMVVTPKALIITANNQSMPFGGPLPKLTASYSGFVNGDSSSSLTTQPKLSTTATTTSPPGTYPITVSGAVDPNYAITYFSGTLTIGRAPAIQPSGAIYVLNATASGALSLSDSAQINTSGNVYVDSRSHTALQASGGAKIVAAATDVVGGIKIGGSASFNPAPVMHTTVPSDPLATLSAPSTSGLTNFGSVNLGGNSSETLSPGIYTSITVSAGARLTFKPGIYIITCGGINVSGNATVSGSGVLLYLEGGGLDITGSASVNLTAATGGSYAGIAFFQSRTNSSADVVSNDAQLNLNGGIFYSPQAQLTVTDSGRVLNATEIINELRLSGNALDQ